MNDMFQLFASLVIPVQTGIQSVIGLGICSVNQSTLDANRLCTAAQLSKKQNALSISFQIIEHSQSEVMTPAEQLRNRSQNMAR